MDVINGKMIPRERYLSKIRPHISKPYVKILTGVRRGGKSTLLKMIAEDISASDPDANTVFIDFELYSNAGIAEADKLYRYISGSVKEGVKNVLMIDEVQEVDGWEKVVSSFNNEGTFDIYIAGSNSRLLSSEYSTYISGRYVSFNIQTLSFSECLDFRRTTEYGVSKDTVLSMMQRHGGMGDSRSSGSPVIPKAMPIPSYATYMRASSSGTSRKNTVSGMIPRSNGL